MYLLRLLAPFAENISFSLLLHGVSQKECDLSRKFSSSGNLHLYKNFIFLHQSQQNEEKFDFWFSVLETLDQTIFYSRGAFILQNV
jgi:hypothetical protein